MEVLKCHRCGLPYGTQKSDHTPLGFYEYIKPQGVRGTRQQQIDHGTDMTVFCEWCFPEEVPTTEIRGMFHWVGFRVLQQSR